MATISYVALANIRPHGYQLRLIANTFLHRSQHSGSTRTLTVPGARWRFTAEYRAMDPTDYGKVLGWLASLEGQGGRFYGFPLNRDWPLGTCRAAGAVAVGAGTVLATTFNASGLGANATLLPGDFFSIASNLYCITAPITASGGGTAALVFKPGLRVAHATSAPITFNRPPSIFKLTADDLGLTFRVGNVADVVIDAEESFV